MPKKAISSLELAALVNELQFLVQGKISQIYHQEKKEMLLQLHARGRGKELLKIISGKWLCLTGMKLVPLRPSGFCMQLRKYINNAVIKDIYQKDAERIVVFELEKEKRYSLIVELFSKGNVILTDEMSTIITSLERQIWKDRVVKPGEKYVFPKSEVNWKKITEKELATILKKSEKKNLAVSLATEVGLGGLYAEEVCRKNEIDKNKIPQDITEKEAKEIINTSKEFLKWIKEPQGYIYEDEVTPFPLMDQKEMVKTKTYNEAINTLKPNERISPYETKINSLNKIITTQEEAIQQLQENIELNTKKGELVYEKYSPLQKLLDIVAEMRKSKEWSEIAKELKKEKKITSIDLKSKTIMVEL